MEKEEMEQDPIVVSFNGVRTNIKGVAANLKKVLWDMKLRTLASSEDRGEVMANLTLAYRHLEDASMRLGKAIQSRDGGVSVYDKTTTVGA